MPAIAPVEKLRALLREHGQALWMLPAPARHIIEASAEALRDLDRRVSALEGKGNDAEHHRQV